MFKLLLAVLPLLPAVLANDPGADFGQAPAIQPLFLNQHKSNPLTGLSFMGVYSTNFGEQPYCCPWNPKQFEVTNPTNPAVQDSNKWGVVPMICQVADAGEGGVFNNNGTILLGNSFVLSNGSLAFHGAAGSRNGAYYYSFASTNSTLKEFDGYFSFLQEQNSSDDGGDLTGPWIWTYLREPTIAECAFTLRETPDTVSILL